MTLGADDRGESSRNRGDELDDAVDVAPGVPTDRVRWGPILAGTFAALTAMAILATLGVAIGLSAYDPGRDNPRNFAIGYGVWGIITTILAFLFGGWLTARVAALRGRDSGLLNGMMVAAFALPLLMFLVGSTGTMIGSSAAENSADVRQARARMGMDNSAVTASARMGDDVSSAGASDGTTGSRGNNTDVERVRKAASRAAWATLVTMLLALGAASVGGYAGARGGDDGDRYRRGRVGGGRSERPATPIV